MKMELVQRVLDTLPGVRKDGAQFLVPEEVDVSLYIGLPSEILAVAKVARVEVAGDLLTAENAKGERFFFAVADLAGVKVGAPEKRASGRGAGFTK